MGKRAEEQITLEPNEHLVGVSKEYHVRKQAGRQVAYLRHKIAKGAVAQDSEHKKIVHTQPLRSARDRGYRSKTPTRPEDRERTRSLCCCCCCS